MKKFLALLMVLVCSLQMFAFAAEFKDMPNDWSTEALERAVENGLLTGSNGYIKASDKMTRAEMATIMVRACGATKTADISAFTDVKPEDWFFDAMSKAVAMGAFNGSDGKLNPNNPITRQEAFVVLSRVFGVAKANLTAYDNLSDFTDGNSIAEWAKKDIAACIGQKYVSGYEDGTFRPDNNITRAEFAVLMDRMVKYYIDEPIDTLPTDGNIMIRANGVDISGYTTDKMVIIGDAVTDENIRITDANHTGKLVLRGSKNIAVNGSYNTIAILCPGITLAAETNNIKKVYVCKDSLFDKTALPIGLENNGTK